MTIYIIIRNNTKLKLERGIIETNELLNYVYENAKMGKESCDTLLKELDGKENKIIDAVEDILKDYKDFEIKAKNMLNEDNAMEPNMFARISASMGIKMKTKSDNSDANIADMLIQGLTMGELEMSKKIENSKKSANKESLNLACNFKKFQKNAINKLKKFL